MGYKAATGYALFAALVLFAGCDNRPDAAGAAHLYNSTDTTVTVLVKPNGGGLGASHALAPGEGWFVPLRKQDTYVISVTSPATYASYREEVVVTAGDETDTVFDIGSAASFAVYPTYHVPRDMPDLAARAEVDRMIEIGDHREFLLETPAPRHTLPRGVYYTFGDEVETYSTLTEPGRTVEIRYKLAAY